MERAEERRILGCDTNRAVQTSMVHRIRVKRQRQTVKVYRFGNPGIDEIFTRLPDLFLDKESKTIKWEKKIRVVRSPLRIGPTIKSVYVKQHNALSFWHRLASLFSASAALRSLTGAVTLLQEGYAIAAPIAAVEYRHRGVLIKSFYLAEEIAGARTIADYWREDLVSLHGVAGRLKRRAVLRTLARVFKSLHEKRIYHNDLKASNILVVDGGSVSGEIFSLIDLQGLKKCSYISKRRRIKNLAQINRTLGNHLTRTEKCFFIKAYVGDDVSDRRKLRRLLRSILEESSRQIAKEKWRQSIAENYRYLELAPAADGLGENECACSTPR